MIYLDAATTRAVLPMSDAIESMRLAFSADVEVPTRTQLGASLFMPGRVGEISAIKVVSTLPGNPVGLVVVFDNTGNPMGIVDGSTLTSIRTGAVCGLATDLLASGSATTLAMLGAGAMAYDQVEAVRGVRPVSRVLVWSRDRSNAAALAERVGGMAVDDVDEAVASADIVSCATPATKPLFSEAVVKPGTHINAVGAFRPEMVEVPAGTVNRSYVVVDDYAAAAAEAGDLIQAGREANASLSELLASTNPEIGEDVTFFKSVGVASQDVAAGHRAIQNAMAARIGTTLA